MAFNFELTAYNDIFVLISIAVLPFMEVFP